MGKTTKEIAGSRCGFCRRNVEEITGKAEGYRVVVIASLLDVKPGKARAYICSHCVRKCIWLMSGKEGVIKFR